MGLVLKDAVEVYGWMRRDLSNFRRSWADEEQRRVERWEQERSRSVAGGRVCYRKCLVAVPGSLPVFRWSADTLE